MIIEVHILPSTSSLETRGLEERFFLHILVGRTIFGIITLYHYLDLLKFGGEFKIGRLLGVVAIGCDFMNPSCIALT